MEESFVMEERDLWKREKARQERFKKSQHLEAWIFILVIITVVLILSARR